MKWLWVFLTIYLSIYLVKTTGYIFPPPIQYYLADLLAVPVVAGLSMCFMRYLTQNKNCILKSWQVIFILILFSISFECLLPLFMKRYTGDVVDVLLYCMGSLFFWKVMNKPPG
ncbi:glycopeptide antibiotics resistance protein [Pedobacter africanus]|uniref:Glycopeptide antibiotics resistance protein n=1 Tax=Pedobacter africanus TaxID=151894 RepID=A0ACC6KT27_9SPHI|nr:hypothetical protein [Pedobacter africanus]MDR6782351.1 glycopeptide antibiotics resistance protein [Pedobacter africanus]